MRGGQIVIANFSGCSGHSRKSPPLPLGDDKQLLRKFDGVFLTPLLDPGNLGTIVLSRLNR